VQQLHEAQIDVPDAVVRSLIDTQFPRWSGLPLTRAASDGTINRVDFLGDNLVVRMPFIDWGADDADRHARLPAELRGALDVALPELAARGEPGDGMPWEWGVYRRIDGRHPRVGDSRDEAALVEGLARFLTEMKSVPIDGAMASPAAFDAAYDDHQTRAKVEALGSPAAMRAWDDAVAAYAAGAPDTSGWIHGDVMPGNLMLIGGADTRLHAVLDWAAAGAGDPALDLLGAWTCLREDARRDLFTSLSPTEDELARARGFAVRKVAWGLPYYRESLPGFAAVMQFTLDQIERD
jgi:aminoglycoside phosphotransferase (APT) family kinase protein